MINEPILQSDISRSVADILAKSYVIPFYQRNYNWGTKEISALLLDIYTGFKQRTSQNYYIGSLVVSSRAEGSLPEVIDGQQRLTTIHLISHLITEQELAVSHLKYDSRKEVEHFFERLQKSKSKIKQTESDANESNLRNFFAAINTIVTTNLNKDIDEVVSVKSLLEKQRIDGFRDYFFNKVKIVEVSMPGDTDVASYFEIMNNRGRQLQEHEILKARMMSYIQSPKDRAIFGSVWDFCSQMEKPIQKFFNPEQRKFLFGDDYDKVYPKRIKSLDFGKIQHEQFSIEEILANKAVKTAATSQGEVEAEVDQDISYLPIIDFPNFLIHVLRQLFSEEHVSLNTEKIIETYEGVPEQLSNQISPMEFLEKLLFYRVVFDRFVIKARTDSEDEDDLEHSQDNGSGDGDSRWILSKPYMQWKNRVKGEWRTASLNFKNTFAENPKLQSRIVKLLSMLQVTYRQKKNKNYLQHILGQFDSEHPTSVNHMTPDKFLEAMEKFLLEQFEKQELCFFADNFTDADEEHFSKGTTTPHFIFNFIDYLLWVDEDKNRANRGITDFDFTYRNSVEHHFSQAQKNLAADNDEQRHMLLHSLGNLFLISKGANSRLSDRSAREKVSDDRYVTGKLTPKRKLMYGITKERNWDKSEIIAHHREIVNLLKQRKEILGYE